jgi:hypothetical protein
LIPSAKITSLAEVIFDVCKEGIEGPKEKASKRSFFYSRLIFRLSVAKTAERIPYWPLMIIPHTSIKNRL